MKYDAAIQELGAWMGSLPLGHPERLGALRAIEVLRAAQGEVGFGGAARAGSGLTNLSPRSVSLLAMRDRLNSARGRSTEARAHIGSDVHLELRRLIAKHGRSPETDAVYRRVLVECMDIPAEHADRIINRQT